MKRVSIVVPVFNEAGSLPIFMGAVQAMISANPGYAFEVVLVDDGSKDDTPRVLRELAAGDPRVKVVSLTKNVGSHIACHAGLAHASGDCFAVIAADMQDPPSIIPGMLERLTGGAKIVWGVRKSRVDSVWVKLFSRLYYRLMKMYVFDNIPEKGADTFLIDRDARDLILRLDEKDTSIFGLLLWSGYAQVFFEYDKQARHEGESKWTFSKKVKLVIDSFVSFSYLPVRLISGIGLLSAVVAAAFASYTVMEWLLNKEAPRGYVTMMLTILTLNSVQFLILGVLGEYLWRAFEHIKQRPLYLVRDVVSGSGTFHGDR